MMKGPSNISNILYNISTLVLVVHMQLKPRFLGANRLPKEYLSAHQLTLSEVDCTPTHHMTSQCAQKESQYKCMSQVHMMGYPLNSSLEPALYIGIDDIRMKR